MVMIDGDFLRRLRRQRRLSLIDAAAMMGKSKSCLWRYENGKIVMSANTLLQLAELYGVSLDQLTTHKMTPRLDSEKGGSH